MKRIILTMTALMSILASCDTKNEFANQESSGNFPENGEITLTPVSLQIDRPSTKALSVNENEAKINTLNVIIYTKDTDGNEKYDSYYTFGSQSSEYVIYIDPNRTDIEEYRFLAYVNQPAMNDETYMKDWALFSNETESNFQMFGQTTCKHATLKTEREVDITVTRQCSSVEVQEIAVKWTNSVNSRKSFKLKGIFLMDVPGVFENDNEVDETLYKNPDLWYNRNGHNSKDKDDLLYDEINVEVTETDAYTTSHYLYGYISDLNLFNQDESWAPGGTRLVIEAEFDGNPCYYAIKLNDLNGTGNLLTDIRNKKIIFNNITITKPGSERPYDELPTEEAINVSVTINEWEPGFEGSYTVQ